VATKISGQSNSPLIECSFDKYICLFIQSLPFAEKPFQFNDFFF
jgi:hypothetical protein